MKIYQVLHHDFSKDGHGVKFFEKKADACREAREYANAQGSPVEVYACDLVPGKAGIVALANQISWCRSEETVYTAKPRKNRKQIAEDIEGLM